MPITCAGARWFAGLLIAVAATSVHGQDCVPPVPFQHQFLNHVTASLSAASPADPCSLTVAVNSGAGPMAAGFLHYRRPAPTTSVRYGFRIDTSALTNFTLANRGIQLFAASSPVVSGTTVPRSHVLLIQLRGGASPAILFSAPKGTDSFAFGGMQLAQTLNTVRVEINVGSGTSGSVRYWLNHDFNEAPDGVIDDAGAGLDNATMVGVIAAEVGLSSPSTAFVANHSGSAIVFDQIESNDDLLFWDDFAYGLQ